MGITGLAAAFGTDITGILNYWADIGVFSYVLPFLLVFSVIYGILGKIGIFGDLEKNKGIYAVIGIAVGLLALQWDIVPEFFGTIFPYAGVGLAILLVAIIMFGLFGGESIFKFKESVGAKVLFFAGITIAVVVIITSLTDWSKWTGGLWWEQFGPALISLAIIGALVGVVIGGGKEKEVQGSHVTAKGSP